MIMFIVKTRPRFELNCLSTMIGYKLEWWQPICGFHVPRQFCQGLRLSLQISSDKPIERVAPHQLTEYHDKGSQWISLWISSRTSRSTENPSAGAWIFIVDSCSTLSLRLLAISKKGFISQASSKSKQKRQLPEAYFWYFFAAERHHPNQHHPGYILSCLPAGELQTKTWCNGARSIFLFLFLM